MLYRIKSEHEREDSMYYYVGTVKVVNVKGGIARCYDTHDGYEFSIAAHKLEIVDSDDY